MAFSERTIDVVHQLCSLASYLQPATDFAEAAAISSNPEEYLLDHSCPFRNWFEPSLPSPVVDADVPVAEWSIRHHIERTALGSMLLAAAAALHDFGSLVLSHDSLNLKKQVIFRALAERSVQEHDLNARSTPLVNHQQALSLVLHRRPACVRVSKPCVSGRLQARENVSMVGLRDASEG